MPRKKPEEFKLDTGKLLIAERLNKLAIEPNILGYRHNIKQARFHCSDTLPVEPWGTGMEHGVNLAKLGRIDMVIHNRILNKSYIAKVRFYVGGNRSGKTVGGIVEDIWWVTKTHPYIDINAIWPEPIRGRICTTDFINGGQGIIIPALKRWIPPSELRGGTWDSAWDAEERTLNFANEGFIELRSYDQQLNKHAGTSRHFVHFDEEPPEEVYDENMARLTDTGGRAWFTLTPVDGMTWTFDDLYEPALKGEAPFTVVVVTASTADNPWIEDEEVDVLRAILGKREGGADTRVEGEYVAKTGLIYKEFDRDTHVIKHHQGELPDLSNATIIASLDHGFTNPTAWLWHAILPTGRLVTFWEWYQKGLVVREHALKVLEINRRIGRQPDFYVGDPSIRNTDPITKTSILEEYSKFGILINASPGLNDVETGIDRVKAFMKPIWQDPVTGDLRSFWSVYQRCEKTIWEAGRYRWAEWIQKGAERQHNKKETPRKKDDHAMDSLRYCAMAFPNFEQLVKDLIKIETPIQVSPVGASKVYAKPENQIDHELAAKLNPNQRAGGWGEYDNFDSKTEWTTEPVGEW